MKKIVTLGVTALSIVALTACSSNTKKETKPSVTKVKKPKQNKDSMFVKDASQSYFKDNVLKGNTYSIKITDVKIIKSGEKGNEYGEKPIIVFFYDTLVAPDYDNSAPISPMLAWDFIFKAVQDNNADKVNALNHSSYDDEELSKNSSSEIKPGGTVKSAEAYELSDDKTPVKLIANNAGEKLGEHTYKLVD